MARGVNKVILVGNLGKNLKLGIHKLIVLLQISLLLLQNLGKIRRQGNKEKKQNGIE